MDKKFSEVGERLRELRGQATQKDFAFSLGISLPALQNYEAGYRLPPGEVLTRAARLCATSVDWILSGEDAAGGGAGRGLFVAEGSPAFEVMKKLSAMPKNRQAHFRDILKMMLKDEQGGME